MSNVIIYPITDENMVQVVLLKGSSVKTQATLLSNRGERINEFELTNEITHLDLSEYASGDYVLKVETETEVSVRQIQLNTK